MANFTSVPTASLAATPAQNLATLAARLLIAWMFVPAGWGKIATFTGVVGYISSKGVPFPEVCAAIAICAELGLGLLLLVGFQGRWAALGLAIFVACITPIFHNYWDVAQAAQQMQKQAFEKNLAIVGGLLVLWAFGPGGWSIDGMRRDAS